MRQLVLIETEHKPVEYMKNGMLHRKHEWGEECNFNGFRRTNYRGEGWKFYICGFCGPQLADGSDGIGHVLMWDGGETECQMDMKGRVRINGRWYDYNKWDH